MKNVCKLTGIITCLILSACQSIPVSIPFPEAPEDLIEAPKEMLPITIRNRNSLVDVLSEILDNNTICVENTIKLRAWQVWYEEQKKIRELPTTLKGRGF